jgi:hypothetical protein
MASGWRPFRIGGDLSNVLQNRLRAPVADSLISARQPEPAECTESSHSVCNALYGVAVAERRVARLEDI